VDSPKGMHAFLIFAAAVAVAVIIGVPLAKQVLGMVGLGGLV
jgi:hypothetical protein